MTVRATVRRASTTLAGRVAAALTTVAACGVLAVALAGAADANPYPPSTPPCLVSLERAPGSGSVTVTGSGLGHQQVVHVIAFRERTTSGTTVGSWTTDAQGGFQATVDLSPVTVSWVRAATRSTSCGTSPPPPGGGSSSSSAPSSSASTQPGSSGAPVGVGPGSTPGSSGGAVTGRGAGTGSAPGASGPGLSSGASRTHSAPPSSSNGPTTPSSSASRSSAPPALANPVSNLGLPASLVVSIAVLLLLAGGLAVIFLTRRA